LSVNVSDELQNKRGTDVTDRNFNAMESQWFLYTRPEV